MPSKKILPKVIYYIITLIAVLLSILILRNLIPNAHSYLLIYTILLFILGFNLILNHKTFSIIDLALHLSLYVTTSLLCLFLSPHDWTFLPVSIIYLVFFALASSIPFLYRGYRDKLNESITANIYSPIIEDIIKIEGESLAIRNEISRLESSKENMTFIYQLMKDISEKMDIQDIFQQLKEIFLQKTGIDNLVIILRGSEKSTDKTRYSLEFNLDDIMKDYIRYIENKVGHFFLLTNLSSYTLRIADDFPGFEQSEKNHYESFVIIPFYMQKINKGFVGFFLRRSTDLKEEVLNFAIFTVRNISLALNKVLLYEKIKALSTVDGLTKLALHRVFDEKLAEEFSRAKRYRKTLSLVMMDIDHFKKFNDNYGHLVGDQVLQKVGAHIAQHCEQDMTAARYGGEEFALICPDANNVEQLVRSIKKAIQTDHVKAENGEKLKITISMGISSCTESTKDPAELIAQADEALYAAKRAGRDRIAVFPDTIIQTGI
jgi:diguanylate cyclase (GGDEF)-like protein